MGLVSMLFVLGLLLITLNELARPEKERVITKYIPRELDAWLKDPENQPTYLYADMFREENVRTF